MHLQIWIEVRLALSCSAADSANSSDSACSLVCRHMVPPLFAVCVFGLCQCQRIHWRWSIANWFVLLVVIEAVGAHRWNTVAIFCDQYLSHLPLAPFVWAISLFVLESFSS